LRLTDVGPTTRKTGARREPRSGTPESFDANTKLRVGLSPDHYLDSSGKGLGA